MSDYIENLIQKQISGSDTNVQPRIEPVYNPIRKKQALNTDSDEFPTFVEQENETTIPQSQNSRLRQEALDLKVSQSHKYSEKSVNHQPETKKTDSKSSKIKASEVTITEQKRTNLRSQTGAYDVMTTKRLNDTRHILSDDNIEKKLKASESELEVSWSKRVDSLHDRDEKTIKPSIKSFSSELSAEDRESPIIGKGKIRNREEIIPLHNKERQMMQPASSTIHVSIGKIEVRAIFPPVTPRKTMSPVQPKMSLEDYLNRREEGNR